MSRTETKPKPFNIVMNEQDKHALTTAAETRDCSIAHLIRMAYKAYIDHELHDQPTCANGTRCLCPLAWSRPTHTEKPARDDQ